MRGRETKKAYAKAYRAANLDAERARSKAYYEANRELIAEKRKATRAARVTKRTVVCSVCQTKFNAGKGPVKTCSSECRRKMKADRRRINAEKINARNKVWRAKNKETVRRTRKDWEEKNRGLLLVSRRMYYAANIKKALIAGARKRAVELGLPFNITEDDICIPSHCPVLGVELIIGRDNPGNSPTIDRVKPDAGYVKGNVIVISHKANTIKSDATYDEIQCVANYVREQERRIQECFDKGMSHFTPASKPAASKPAAKTEKAKRATL